MTERLIAESGRRHVVEEILGKSFELWSRIIKAIEDVRSIYDDMNKAMTLGLESIVRRIGISLVVGRRPKTILDLGAGPGTSTRQLLKVHPYTYIIALEPSIELARGLKCQRDICCERIVGVAENIPLRSKSIDVSMAFFSARDFMDPLRGFKEARRVSRNRIVIADIFIPRRLLSRIILKVWVCLIIPVIAILKARRSWRSYRMLCETLKGWMTIDRAKALLKGLLVGEGARIWDGALGVIYADIQDW
ncbi:MAG: class I SAM-dependent methyltransferase [Pyrodictiaceae archaeon]